MATTTTPTASTMPPTVLTANTTAVADPTGAASWSVATITTSTIQDSLGTFNAENVTYYLRGAAATGLNGAISADFVVGTDGHTLIPTDTIFYEPPGDGVIATYYGSELNDPLLAPYAATVGNPGSPGFSPANPGYAYTQYIYDSTGALTQVVAAEPNGQIFIGTGTAVL